MGDPNTTRSAGGSTIKPLVGRKTTGPQTRAVRRCSNRRRASSYERHQFAYGLIVPYWMALAVIDEARGRGCVGGDRKTTAILDNFCWESEVPERLGELVRAARGCYDGAMHFETPFISGKDSFHNEYSTPKGTIAIPPTLLISAISVVDDTDDLVTMDLKEPGHFLYLVGLTKPELGGSYYWERRGKLGRSVPKVDLENASLVMDRLTTAIRIGTVRACHDLSEGGLGVALAEMAFASGVGADVDLGMVPFVLGTTGESTADVQQNSSVFAGRSDVILFSESQRDGCARHTRGCRPLRSRSEGVPKRRIGQTIRTESPPCPRHQRRTGGTPRWMS